MLQLEIETEPRLPPPATMWTACRDRDASFEGVFWTCVKTTGIFCRPTCTARTPKRENVEFVASVIDAERLGYRACKRCRPLEDLDAAPDWARELMEGVRREPGRRLADADLRLRGLEPARVRRYFQSRFGVTFQGWQRALRLGAAMRAMRAGSSVSAASFDAGFESESGFREAWGRVFGEPPLAATAREPLVAARFTTPLGVLLGVVSSGGVVMCEFLDRRALEAELVAIRRRFRTAILPGEHEHLSRLQREVEEYFDGQREDFEVPLDPVATPFQRAVWDALREIPYGVTRSYQKLAEAIGRPGAQRAVGRANGQNRIAILVPCHRVIGSDGALRGYGGGLWRKQRLLELEQARLRRRSGLPVEARPEA